MAEGMSNFLANKFLDALGNNTTYAATAVYVKLHVGVPGAAGTNNPATEVTRKSASFGAASGGSILSDADISWTSIGGSQDATHFTAWDDVTTGNFLFSGSITANAYTAGDTYTIPSGSLSSSFTIAS